MSLARITWRCCLYLSFIYFFSTACTPSTKKDPVKEEDIYPLEEDKPDAQQKKEPKIHVVEIKQMMFQPSEVKVQKGDQVLWINKDITDHDVTEQTTKAWASSPLSKGESWSLTVTKTTDYYCNLHQVMKGKIIVE